MINQNINFETPNKIGDENESNPDLNNEDYIKKVFESGTKEELEKITNQYNFTPEQIKLFSHFAKLRKNILDEMRPQIEARRQNRPLATKEELNMGAYLENIEPQVRQTVFDLRKNGYATYGSGFSGFDSQEIYFEKKCLENFQIPTPTVDKFKEQGIIIEIKPNRIKLIFEKEFNQEEICSFWQEIESYLPDLGEPAQPCQLSQAVLFRERQKGLASLFDLENEKKIVKERNATKITEIKVSLGLEQVSRESNMRKYFQNYLELKEGEVEKIELIKASDLPKNYRDQMVALNDKRLDDVIIAVIPDNLWVKGTQPSESAAEEQIISIKKSYFEERKNTDEIAWLTHELAHCQNFLDSKTDKDYQKNMQKFAFEDLKTEYPYPNNPVERYTFTKQFQFLKKEGKSRENIVEMIHQYYHKEDLPFFDRLLDNIYGK